MSKIETTHKKAIIINGASPSEKADVAIANFLEGGVTATSYTFVMDGNFLSGVQQVTNLLTEFERLGKTQPVRIARTTQDIYDIKKEGGTAIIVGFQSGDPIEQNLNYLDTFYHLGLRIFQLTYQRRNYIADGCGEVADAGLSIFGKEVIRHCNKRGILIDLSHVGYRSSMEAIEASTQPVTFTHCNLHSVNPIARNKRDEQIKAVAAKGGVVGVGAISRFITHDGGQKGVPLDTFLDQIDYLVNLIGINHVGIGLDIVEGMTAEDFKERQKTFFASFPELKTGGDFPYENYYVRGLNSSAHMMLITEGLLTRGYHSEEVGKILGGNFMRLFDVVWGNE